MSASPRPPRAVSATALAGVSCLWVASAGNAPLWRELHAVGILDQRGGWLLALALAGVLAAALFALVGLLNWRWLFKPALVLLFVASTVAAHFMWTYHVVIDSTMAANALQTDWHEVQSLLSWQFAAVLVAGAGLPSWLVWRCTVRHRPWRQQAWRNLVATLGGLAVVVALVLASFQPLASTMRNRKELRYLLNPLNVLWAAGQSTFAEAKAHGPLLPVGHDASIPSGPPRLLLLVLGETARSDHFGLNGYERDTTPELARARVASFTNAWSCGTNTATSVPCMFSPLGREGFLARTRDSENLMDVLAHAGLAVLWIDNQPGGCKGVCDRVPHVDTSALADPAHCEAGSCRDGILLAGLDERIAALPPEQRARGVVLVMHQMGSHGPAYAQRVPADGKRFLPECGSNHLPDCDPGQLRNAYDNTIAYTDQVLGSAIAWLRRRTDYDTALLYVADHGESLGENNLYLHGLPYAIAPDAQKHVPWITWLSPAFERASGIGLDCLRARPHERITHDHLFHSVLGLMQVGTAAYRRELDAYAGCAAH